MCCTNICCVQLCPDLRTHFLFHADNLGKKVGLHVKVRRTEAHPVWPRSHSMEKEFQGPLELSLNLFSSLIFLPWPSPTLEVLTLPAFLEYTIMLYTPLSLCTVPSGWNTSLPFRDLERCVQRWGSGAQAGVPRSAAKCVGKLLLIIRYVGLWLTSSKSKWRELKVSPVLMRLTTWYSDVLCGLGPSRRVPADGGEVTQAPPHLCCGTQYEQQFYCCPRLLLEITDRHNMNEEEGRRPSCEEWRAWTVALHVQTQHRRRKLSTLRLRDTR